MHAHTQFTLARLWLWSSLSMFPCSWNKRMIMSILNPSIVLYLCFKFFVTCVLNDDYLCFKGWLWWLNVGETGRMVCYLTLSWRNMLWQNMCWRNLCWRNLYWRILMHRTYKLSATVIVTVNFERWLQPRATFLTRRSLAYPLGAP